MKFRVEYKYENQKSFQSFTNFKNKTELLEWWRGLVKRNFKTDVEDEFKVKELMIPLQDDLWIYVITTSFNEKEAYLMISDDRITKLLHISDVTNVIKYIGKEI